MRYTGAYALLSGWTILLSSATPCEHYVLHNKTYTQSGYIHSDTRLLTIDYCSKTRYREQVEYSMKKSKK